MTATITHLPPETLAVIIAPLDYGDIFALMLCSRNLYTRLFPSLYEEIVFVTHGPCDRPLLSRSPRRFTERNRKKFFAGVVNGTIPDDALASIKRVIMTDIVSETYLHEGVAPERIQVLKSKMLPKMIKLRNVDLVLGQGTVFMRRTSLHHCLSYYQNFISDLRGVDVSLDVAGKSFMLATAFVSKHPHNIVYLSSSLPSYWDNESIALGRRLLTEMLVQLTQLRHLDLEGGLEEPAEFFDFSLFEDSLPYLESLTLRRIFEPVNLLPHTNLKRFKRLALYLCDVFDREFNIIAQMDSLTSLIIDQTPLLPIREGPPTPRQPNLAPLSLVTFTQLKTFHLLCDISEFKRAYEELDESEIHPIAIAPPGFVHAVIISNPLLRSIVVPSLSNDDLSILAQPPRAHTLETLELLVPSTVGMRGAYTSQGLIHLFSAPCKRLKSIRFSTLNAKISTEMLRILLTRSPDLKELSWDCLDFDRSGDPLNPHLSWQGAWSNATNRFAELRLEGGRRDLLLEHANQRSINSTDAGLTRVQTSSASPSQSPPWHVFHEPWEARLRLYRTSYREWATKILSDCFVPEDRAFLVDCLSQLGFTTSVQNTYRLTSNDYFNNYKLIDGVDSNAMPRRDGLFGFKDLLGLS